MGGDTRSGSRRHDKGRTASRGRTIVEYVVLAVVAVAVALLIQAFLVKPYRIPSASMEDTLLIGDRVLVDRVSWRFSQPERGDIVVYHPPCDGPMMRLISTGPSNGGWNTTMSPRSGCEKRQETRSTSTRSPISSVSSMDAEGMRYGLTRKAWMSSATATATTASTTYSTMVRPLEAVRPLSWRLLPLRVSPPMLSFADLGAVYQSPCRRESGQYVKKASPMISRRGAGPQSRLSSLTTRLSPMRK